MQDGDLVSAPIDLIFNDHVDASCWRRAPRPFKGKLVVANVLVIGLIVAYSARAVPLVAVATALAAGVVAAVAWWLGGRPLAAIEGEKGRGVHTHYCSCIFLYHNHRANDLND